MRQAIGVVFGSPSPEHDVSVITGHQVMDALDPRKYDVMPIYMDFEGRFFTDPSMFDVAVFRPYPRKRTEVVFSWGQSGPRLIGLGGKPEIRIDCVIPAMHGAFGEDGKIQALLETIGIPFIGFSSLHSAIAMRKDLTKDLAGNEGVNVLPQAVISRSAYAKAKSASEFLSGNLSYPVIVKPCSLGSSIGVGIAEDEGELAMLVENVLYLDENALVEPKVDNLVEYNVSVINAGGEVRFSAIEEPKSSAALLDFKQKYQSGGTKGMDVPSEGMLSLTRTINPDISREKTETIYKYAEAIFLRLGGKDAPRFDFLCNSKTGEIWFNEINTLPGSFAHFLWERAKKPLLFPELLRHLIDEGLTRSVKEFDDPVPVDARLLPRG